jgi:hypothetical protein
MDKVTQAAEYPLVDEDWYFKGCPSEWLANLARWEYLREIQHEKNYEIFLRDKNEETYKSARTQPFLIAWQPFFKRRYPEFGQMRTEDRRSFISTGEHELDLPKETGSFETFEIRINWDKPEQTLVNAFR